MWKQVREIMELEYSGADAATVKSSKRHPNEKSQSTLGNSSAVNRGHQVSPFLYYRNRNKKKERAW